MSGELPSGWRWTRLGNECEVQIGGTPARDEPAYWDTAKDGGNRWVSISDLQDKVISETKEYITDLGVQKSNVKLVKPGTVMMSFKLSIGRVAIAGRPLFTNEAIAAFIPRTHEIDRDFLYYVLPMSAESGDIDQAVKGKTLNKAKLIDLDVLLPPLPEQKKIAAILSSVDEAIRATQAVIDQTRRVKEGLLQDLLTRGIGHTRFKMTEIGEIPEGWEVRDLFGLCDRITKGTTPTTYGHDYTDSGVLFLRVENVTADGKLDLSDTKHVSEQTHATFERSMLIGGEVLLSIAGAIGRAAVVTPDAVPANINQALAVLRLKPGAIDATFLLHVVLSRVVQRQIDGLRAGLAQFNLNLKQVGSLVVPLPPMQEQLFLRDHIERLASALERAELQHEALIRLKSGLLQDLLTGRVRVTP